jgi:nucleotide-binding universal stress UspA family protein
VLSGIVVGVDGSEDGEKALGYATGLARREGARLILAHVEEYTIGKGGGPIRADEDEFRADLARRAERLSAAGIETSVETASVMVGGPARAIVGIVDAVGADLIVVGSRGHSATLGVILGSVAQRLLHLADRPVLVIPADAPSAGDG